MQRNLGDVVADIEFLARGIALEAARDRSSDSGLVVGAEELRNMSQQPHSPAITLPDASKSALLRRQHDRLAAIAEKLCADAQEHARTLALADAGPGVAAWCDYRDADLRELVTELSARRQQFEQDLLRDRERFEFASGNGLTGFESGSAGAAAGVSGGFDKIPLDRGDIEMV